MNGGECISDHVLDLLVAGELSAQQTAAARSHMTECLTCRRAHREIVETEAAFARQAPPFDRVVPRRKPAAGWTIWVGAAAMILVAFGLTLGGPPAITEPPVEAPVELARAKGSNGNVVYFRKRGPVVTPVSSGDEAAGRDRIAARLGLREASYVAWYGRNPRGPAALYFPLQGPATEFGAGQHDLPTSVELDDAEGVETLWLLICPTTFAPADATAAPIAWAAAHGCVVDTLELQKVPR